jgi:uncharacterized membrane-anchored protein
MAEESRTEKLNRKWQDQLQELRVMQTGAQLTAGFLLTLPFQQPTFDHLSDFQKGLYLALVALAGFTVLVVVSPVAVHRRLSGEDVKERVIKTAHRCLLVAVVSLALLIAGMLMLIFSVVLSTTVGVVVGAIALVVEGALLLVLPQLLSRDQD